MRKSCYVNSLEPHPHNGAGAGLKATTGDHAGGHAQRPTPVLEQALGGQELAPPLPRAPVSPTAPAYRRPTPPPGDSPRNRRRREGRREAASSGVCLAPGPREGFSASCHL